VSKASDSLPVILAVTGASGSIYGQRLLRALAERSVPIGLVLSDSGCGVWRHELAAESPHPRVHLDALLSTHDAGATILPATPSFNSRPSSLDEANDTVLAGVLDHLRVAGDLTTRWQGEA